LAAIPISGNRKVEYLRWFRIISKTKLKYWALGVEWYWIQVQNPAKLEEYMLLNPMKSRAKG
jgi:hypothetical protein